MAFLRINRSFLAWLCAKSVLLLAAVFIGAVCWKLSNVIEDGRYDIDLASQADNVDLSQFKYSLDESATYRVYDVLVVPDVQRNDLEKDDVTLVSHCTVQHLRFLPVLAETWAAPISLAVFLSSRNVPQLVEIFSKLRLCSDFIRRFVSVHAVSPTADERLATFPKFTSCKSMDELFYNFDAEANYENLVYPGNLLRNTGRRNARTNFTFVIDIDFLPNRNLSSAFNNFASTRGERITDKDLFVVPAFELQRTVRPVPTDKRALLIQLRRLSARPFYFESCWKCQKYTNYQAWQNLPPGSLDLLDVAYNVDWQDPWEPFYISSNTVPLFDERFKQYGFNRISQVCELHVAGYRFAVLDNAFLIHSGFKTSQTFHRTKHVEQERNRLLFRQFKTKLVTKYNDSSRTCW